MQLASLTSTQGIHPSTALLASEPEVVLVSGIAIYRTWYARFAALEMGCTVPGYCQACARLQVAFVAEIVICAVARMGVIRDQTKSMSSAVVVLDAWVIFTGTATPFAMAVTRVPVSIIAAVAVISAIVVRNARLICTSAATPFAMAITLVPVSFSLAVAVVSAVVTSVTWTDRAFFTGPFSSTPALSVVVVITRAMIAVCVAPIAATTAPTRAAGATVVVPKEPTPILSTVIVAVGRARTAPRVDVRHDDNERHLQDGASHRIETSAK